MITNIDIEEAPRTSYIPIIGYEPVEKEAKEVNNEDMNMYFKELLKKIQCDNRSRLVLIK